MYAIIKESGRQYRIQQGDVILVDRMGASEGSEIQFDKILFVDGKVGLPYVDGAKVTGVVKGEVLGKKLYVQKFKRRKKYRRRVGHRQQFTEVEIKSIEP